MKIFSIALSIAALLSLTSTDLKAYTIEDNYWGGTPTHNWSARDIIGASEDYDISSMDVTVSGNTMTVTIYSSFFDKVDSQTIKTDSTNMGDLFISTSGWNPNTTGSNYSTDTILTTGTLWDYAVVLDHHGQTAGDGFASSGTASLYKMQGNGTVEASGLNGLSNDNWVYRKDQMYRFNPGTNSTALDEDTWALSDISGTIYDKLTFTFDISDLLDQATSQEWGFHWTMSCGNDVIEGEAPIPNPEPSTLLLTGFGILGVAYLRRKRKQ
ncbi:MAG: PEP-CTERM sorting domain-containing protein [Geobacter sp.]|nr:MAG: PEP-CTERM sorting domain-containing protein [Geobacter sp.]